MFKRAKVVMLPTNEKADKGNICFGYYGLQMLKHSDGKTIANKQHLYILSDDEIKEGDWAFSSLTNTIKQITNVRTQCGNNKGFPYEKIIATTDTELWTKTPIKDTWGHYLNQPLPSPSQSFINKYIDEYNKGNVITDVLVEYDEMYLFPDGSYSRSAQNMLNVKAVDLLKISKDNTITIKKVKDSWSRDEVEKLILKYALDEHDVVISPRLAKWIDENL